MSIGVVEWREIRAQYNNCCALCGISETSCGGLEKAHRVAKSKGGSQIIPLCPNCHKRYDSGDLGDWELQRLGIDSKDYYRHLPAGKVVNGNSNSKSVSEMSPSDWFNL